MSAMVQGGLVQEKKKAPQHLLQFARLLQELLCL
jgi:hypothetical protein